MATPLSGTDREGGSGKLPDNRQGAGDSAEVEAGIGDVDGNACLRLGPLFDGHPVDGTVFRLFGHHFFVCQGDRFVDRGLANRIDRSERQENRHRVRRGVVNVHDGTDPVEYLTGGGFRAPQQQNGEFVAAGAGDDIVCAGALPAQRGGGFKRVSPAVCPRLSLMSFRPSTSP
ncbi:hypothetical protein OFAG_02180 [Oxalobacter formigenes HOxBLS]|uniref:Uncharacterized protein n=1 Tax=Oxalobacter paraformigenes TaxID=556268 RepID=T5LT84_9BURK|nr:hypothetical protein OFAG_02180 [Oxalobacter paraformigenes]